jgi:hypothetical protein
MLGAKEESIGARHELLLSGCQYGDERSRWARRGGGERDGFISGRVGEHMGDRGAVGGKHAWKRTRRWSEETGHHRSQANGPNLMVPELLVGRPAE